MSDTGKNLEVVGSHTGRSDTYYGSSGELDQEAGLLYVRSILAVLRRWWWFIALIITFCTAITTVVLFRMSPIYKATATLEVKQEERNIVDVSAIERITVDNEYLTTQIELLQSESLIEDTIERLNLLTDSHLVPLGDPKWQSLSRGQRLRGLVQSFKDSLSVQPVGRSRLISLSFEHVDSNRAALIANTMVENFLANGLSRKFNATADARSFLSQRLEVVRSSLEAAERNLVEYAKNNGIISVSSEDTSDSSVSIDMDALIFLNEELNVANLARVEAQANYERSLTSDFMDELLRDESISRLKSERIALNAEYLENLAVYKSKTPLMIELISRIELFDQEIEQRKEDLKSAAQFKAESAYKLALIKQEDLKKRVSDLKASVVDTREKSVDYNILKRQVETDRTQYEALLQRLKEVSVSSDLGSNLIEVVDSAQVPNFPFKPNRPKLLILTILLSGILGIAISYILEFLDDHIKGPDDVKNKLGQIIMGVIPTAKNPNDILDELVDSQSAISEAYSSLRTNIQFSSIDGGPRIIQITSTRSGEGKSTTSLAIALRFIGIGKKVLLIDADMRLPTFLNAGDQSIGLSGVLTSRVDYGDEIVPSQYDNLDLLPSGVIVPNPSEILSHEQFEFLLHYAREHYDYIIVDGPPVLGLADAPTIGAKVDATLLVIEAEKLRTPNVKAAIERLQSSGTKVIGVVLTKYKAHGSGYMDYYNYAYSEKNNVFGNKSRIETKAKKTKRKLDIT